MTEEEAKAKWCPFVRMTVESDNQYAWSNRNEAVTTDKGSKCIASACMAWRWTNDYERRWDLPEDEPPQGAGWQRVQANPGVAHWVRQHKTPHGYCGLGGEAR